MLQYKIPQNVGIEDKIVGPLSLRQLIIIAVGGGTSYVLFAIMNKLYELNFLEYAVIAIPALVSVAAALIRINDISFTRFVLLALEFAIKPKKRAWDHRGIAPLVAPNLGDLRPKEARTAKEEKSKKPVNLDELSRMLDSSGFKDVRSTQNEDMDKAGDEELVTQAFFGKQKSETENMYWRANKRDPDKKRLDILAKLPHTAPKKEEVKKEEPVKKPVEPQKPPVTQTTVTPPLAPIPTPRAPAAPPTIPQALQKPTPKKIETPVFSPKPPQPQKPVQPPKPIQQLPKPQQAFRPQGGNRPRQKPTKQGPPPVPQRQNTQVNTIQKSKPVQFVPQPKKIIPPPPPKKSAQGPLSGEIRLEDLKRGDINLDLDD